MTRIHIIRGNHDVVWNYIKDSYRKPRWYQQLDSQSLEDFANLFINSGDWLVILQPLKCGLEKFFPKENHSVSLIYLNDDGTIDRDLTDW